MAKASRKKSKRSPGKTAKNPDPPRPRIPARIKAYSGSGFHTPGKYGTKERRAAGREIERDRD